MKTKSFILALLFVAISIFSFAGCGGASSGNNVRILFIGNSFIYSSDVGAILQSIANENDQALQTESASYGGGIVSQFYNYAESAYEEKETYEWGYKLFTGYYDYLMLQAVFENKDNGVQSFISKFEELNIKTKIILFPADNEIWETTLSLQSQYNLPVMPWYKLVHELLNRGLTSWDLNQAADDWHANALSGYSAAVMIYYSLYGEMPETLFQTHEKLMEGYYIQGSSIAPYNFSMRGTMEEQLERFATIRTTAKEIVQQYSISLN